MSAYLLTLAIFIPSSGWMADRYGSETIFVERDRGLHHRPRCCAASRHAVEFAAARILQGVGGAMMVPVGRLVVLRGTEKHELVSVMQFISTPGLIAPVLGPPVGGFITTFSSWRWIFFLNMPIGLLGLALVVIFMVNHKREERRSFDVAGFVLSGAGLASLMFGLDQLGRPSFAAAVTAALIGGGAVVCAFAFVHCAAPRTRCSISRSSGSRRSRSRRSSPGPRFRMVIGTTPFLWPLMFQVGFGMRAFARAR